MKVIFITLFLSHFATLILSLLPSRRIIKLSKKLLPCSNENIEGSFFSSVETFGPVSGRQRKRKIPKNIFLLNGGNIDAEEETSAGTDESLNGDNGKGSRIDNSHQDEDTIGVGKGGEKIEDLNSTTTTAAVNIEEEKGSEEKDKVASQVENSKTDVANNNDDLPAQDKVGATYDGDEQSLKGSLVAEAPDGEADLLTKNKHDQNITSHSVEGRGNKTVSAISAFNSSESDSAVDKTALHERNSTHKSGNNTSNSNAIKDATNTDESAPTVKEDVAADHRKELLNTNEEALGKISSNEAMFNDDEKSRKKTRKKIRVKKMRKKLRKNSDRQAFVTANNTPAAFGIKSTATIGISASTNTTASNKNESSNQGSSKKKRKKKRKVAKAKTDSVPLTQITTEPSDSDDEDFSRRIKVDQEKRIDAKGEILDGNDSKAKQTKDLSEIESTLENILVMNEDDDEEITEDIANEVDNESSSEEEDHSTEKNKLSHSKTVRKKRIKRKKKSRGADGLTVSIVTWNLAETAPDPDDADFIRDLIRGGRSSPDIVLIGGQECENTKPRRSEGRRSRLFRSLAIKNLGRDYVPLAIHSLGGVQCLLFCHRRVHPYVELVNVADVACGIGNVFHNKGAVGVYVQLQRRSIVGGDNNDDDNDDRSVKMLFVAAHMAAHVKNVESRNEDFWRICAELEAKSPPRFLSPKKRRSVKRARRMNNDDDNSIVRRRSSSDLSSGAGISMSATGDSSHDGKHLLGSTDVIFFCGDLNYRIDLPRETTERAVEQVFKNHNIEESSVVSKARDNLLLNDQLLCTIASREAFPDFNEGKIDFPPTFKFDKGTGAYDTSHKQRIPAWTDRILFRQRSSSKQKFGITVMNYDSAHDSMHSDHRPVYGTFLVRRQTEK